MARTSDIMAVVLQIEFIATAGDIEISRRIALASVKKARLNPTECNNKINLGAWGLGRAQIYNFGIFTTCMIAVLNFMAILRLRGANLNTAVWNLNFWLVQSLKAFMLWE